MDPSHDPQSDSPKKRRKPALRNLYDRATLERRLAAEPFARRTVSFYRYVRLDDPKAVRDQLFAEWDALGVFGRVYVAREGINAQISVPEPHWAAYADALYAWTEYFFLAQSPPYLLSLQRHY